MSQNSPEIPPPITVTPVEFSPTSNADEIGSVGHFPPLLEMEFPLAVPVTIIVLTLIFSSVRDIAGFNRRLADIDEQNVPVLEMLKKVPKQTELIQSLQTGLKKLSVTDPDAAEILAEYYPPPTKKTDQDAAAAASK